MLSSRFVWPGLATDTKTWCRECLECGRGKVVGQETTKVEKINIPKQRFSHIHLDLVGPLPVTEKGNRYLVTAIDRTTRWPEAVPVKDIETDTVIEAVVSSWISRFGVPVRITTDRGPQFTSTKWSSWCEELGVSHTKTTAFHPQSNGLVERLHRQIKEGLRARSAANQWDDHLPWVLLGVRTAPKEEAAVSAGEAVLGQQLVVPGQQTPGADQRGSEGTCPPAAIPPTKRTYAEATKGSSQLDCADWVFVKIGGARPPMDARFEGPYRVLRRGPKTFQLQRGGQEEVVSRDRLKPYRGGSEPRPAQPRRRGRPPGTGED